MQECAALDGRGLAFATAPEPVRDEELAAAYPRDPYAKMAKGMYRRFMDSTAEIKRVMEDYDRKDLQGGDGPEAGRYYRPLLTVGSAAGETIDDSAKRRVRAAGGKPYRPDNRVAGPGGDRKLWEYVTRG